MLLTSTPRMKSSHENASSFSYSYTQTLYYHNDHSTPINSTSETLIPIPDPPQSISATKIQSAFRSHRIRNLFKTIATVDREATQIQHSIQRQETVDAIRSNDLEKLKMNEALMKLLLKLDSVPGIDPTVREARRKVSRRIVGLQEIVDAIAETKVDWNWEQIVAEMEEEVCIERGGHEMEKFCAQYLGFRCFQRFLSE